MITSQSEKPFKHRWGDSVCASEGIHFPSLDLALPSVKWEAGRYRIVNNM